MLRRLFIALGVLSFALVAQAATGNPSPECLATGCTCALWQTATCNTASCNSAICNWHGGQCGCTGAPDPTPEQGATVSCTEKTMGSFCNYTCPNGLSPAPKGSYQCEPNNGTTNGGSWALKNTCKKTCTTQPVIPSGSNINAANPGIKCAPTANHGDTCGTYICNDPTAANDYLTSTGKGLWTCTDGAWVVTVADFCAVTACAVPQSTDSTTFYCKATAPDTKILNGMECSYSCTVSDTAQYIPTTRTWCVNGTWTNSKPCVPSCRGPPAVTWPTTTATLRRSCAITQVIGVDGKVIERELNARAGDHCPIYCNTGLDLGGAAAKWWWGTVGKPSGPQEVVQSPCSNSWKCNAADAVAGTGVTAWKKNSSVITECFESCPISALLINNTIDNLESKSDRSGEVACSYTDPTTGNTFYVTTTQANEYAAPFPTALPHGWKCRVQCPSGYLHSGGEGPYCYNGTWITGSRTGHRGSLARCELAPAGQGGAAGIEAPGKNCTGQDLTTAVTEFLKSGGHVEYDSCPLYNEQTLQYNHGRAFRLRCARTENTVLEGSSFIACVNSKWQFGGQTAGNATCTPPQTRTCDDLTAAKIANADATWTGCIGYGPGRYCQYKCKAGFAPKYDYVAVTGTTTGPVNDPWAWWGSGLQCNSTYKWNLPLEQLCVDSCQGRITAGGPGKLDTAGGCVDPGVGCDYFCNADDWLSGNGTTTWPWRDCTGVGCAYDGKKCSPPKVDLSIDILKVGVKIWVTDRLPSNAWMGIYKANEANNYRFLLATHVGALVNTASISGQVFTFVADVSSFNWGVNGGTPFWSGNRTNTLQNLDLEVRVFPDLDVRPDAKPLNTSLMCSNIANSCTKKFPTPTSRAMNVQEYSGVHHHPENLIQELEIRRERLLAQDRYEAARAEYDLNSARIHAEWAVEHAAHHRGAATQGALNQNSAVMPLACLSQTNCTCELYGNNKCDPECNNPECGWDALDCRCLDFPVNATTVSQIGPYASRVCTAGEFGAGTKDNNSTTNQWRFMIGARCELSCPTNWTAAPIPDPRWNITIVAGQAEQKFNVTCRPDANANGAVWAPLWQCRPRCAGKPEDVPGILAQIKDGVEKDSTGPCGNDTLGHNSYYGTPCRSFTCAKDYKADAGMFTCTAADASDVSKPPTWVLVGTPCVKLQKVDCDPGTMNLPNFVKRANDQQACATTGTVPNGGVCNLQCNEAGFGPYNGTVNTAVCVNGSWAVTARCLGPCLEGAWKPGSENGDKLQVNGTAGKVCPAGSLPYGSTPCPLGCSDGFRLWQSEAPLPQDWKCGVTESCSLLPALGIQGSASALWAPVANAVGLPRCYASCNYSALQQLIPSSKPANLTLQLMHGERVNGSELTCTGTTVSNGQTGLPYCYRGAFVWIDTSAVRVTNQWACVAKPAPPAGSTTRTRTPTIGIGQNCTVAQLITFSQTAASQRAGSYVDPKAFVCSDYKDGQKVQGYDGLCGAPSPAPTDIWCKNGVWTWTPTCACGKLPANIPNMDVNATNQKCVSTALGQICDITCLPGFTPMYKKNGANWWLPGAVCAGNQQWNDVPICAPACEGWTTNDTNSAWFFHRSPGVCDITEPALCDWFCGRGLDESRTKEGSPHLECSTPACKAKGVEAQCRPQHLRVSIAPMQVRVGWTFSRDVSQTAFLAFYTDSLSSSWQWARNIPPNTNRGNQTFSVTLALNGNPPVGDDWVLNANQTYNSSMHGDLWVKLFEDHSLTVVGSTALNTTSMCASNVKCAALTQPQPAKLARNQKCQDKGCDCSRLGDGVCDLSCNIDECGWDGGDCGCAAPNNATVRSAESWVTCSRPPAPSTTGQPAYGVNTTCTFTCPLGWVVRDMTNLQNPPLKPPLTTQCLPDPWSLSGGRWQSFVCEAPCVVPPPVVNSDAQQIKWEDACNSQPSGSTNCSYACLNSTWVLPQGIMGKNVLCLDGRYQEWEVKNPPACVPVCKGGDVTLTSFPITNGTGASWSCNDTAAGLGSCVPKCPSGSIANGSVVCNLETQGAPPVAAWRYGKWVNGPTVPACTPPQPPASPVKPATCSLAQLNAQISNGNVFISQCQAPAGSPGWSNDNANDDTLVAVGVACNWTCEPKYVKTGGDPQQQQWAVCQSNGAGAASWGPDGDNLPRCLPPCFQPPPVDGGAHCGVVPYDSVPLGGTCNNWGCDPDFVPDVCTGKNPLQCLNIECSACKYANGALISPVAQCEQICKNGTQSSPYRRWELSTPFEQNAARYRLPYCFRPCYAPFLVGRSGISGCGANTTSRGNIPHGQRCEVTCASNYLRTDVAAPICYDGAFRGVLGGVCKLPDSDTCPSSAECCRTSDLTQPWNARISGDENVDPSAPTDTCREFWPSGANVTFECNTAPSSGNPQYKWYTGGTDNVLLGDGSTSAVAQCGTDGKWWWWYNGNKLASLPKCKSQTSCSAILYDPTLPQGGLYTFANGTATSTDIGRPLTFGAQLNGTGGVMLGVVCNATGPGGDCVIQCQPGYTPVFEVVGNVINYGPVCDAQNNNWRFVPKCAPACIASGCEQPYNYSTACDGICQDDIQDYECSGPACNNDNSCPPRKVTIDIRPASLLVEITSDKPLAPSAWVGAFRRQEGATTGNYRWSGAQKLKQTSAPNSLTYTATMNIELGQTMPNQYIDGQLEVKLFHDLALAPGQELGKAVLCEPCDFCKGFDVGTCPVIPPPAAPTAPVAPSPPSPPAAPVAPGAPGAPGSNGTPSGPGGSNGTGGAAANGASDKEKLFLALFIVFLVTTILLAIAVIVLFLKLRAAGAAKGSNYSQL